MWLSLKQDPLLEPHCNVVKKHCNQALTIEHLVPYKLHPRYQYQGEHLTKKQVEDIYEYLITDDSSFMATLISFQAAPFPQSFSVDASNIMNQTAWWKAVEKCGRLCRTGTSVIISSCFFSIHQEDFFKLWWHPHSDMESPW
ncbi:hypothetical protein LSH36_676g00018 [Paralvinella palmiformis]|uniref:Uncharacterized protein n=1 Tax=Paralvinella palmiformis TaxID=53620 RepID=A0AAD9MVD2_9ANNE|nr:hypothetical protein LSH36_676g00018 [Paralvinella palmiformis]